MAILQQPVQNDRPFADRIGTDVAPAGTWLATIVDIQDEFGVSRPKFENPQETEVVDLTTFLFGFRDESGAVRYATSRSMRISGNEKSSLFGFLKSLLGRAPQYGWDYCELKGRQCLLTVEHQTRRDGAGVFASIAALSPVPQGMGQPMAARPAGTAQGMATGPAGVTGATRPGYSEGPMGAAARNPGAPRAGYGGNGAQAPVAQVPMAQTPMGPAGGTGATRPGYSVGPAEVQVPMAQVPFPAPAVVPGGPGGPVDDVPPF